MAMDAVSAVEYGGLIKEDRVNGRVYYDPAIFREEMDKVWHRGWVYVGHLSEVPDPGDYVTRPIGQQPVIMVRGEDGEVRLLLNRCRHRGNLVCQNERGKAAFLRCDYHGWTYSNKGDLVKVTGSDAYDTSYFRQEDYGLAPVARQASYRGFLFGSVSSTGVSLDEHLGAARVYIDSFVERSLEGEVELCAGVQKSRYRGNWKMLPENSVEGFYHGQVLHQHYMDQRFQQRRSGETRSSSGSTLSLPGGHMVSGYRTRMHVDVLSDQDLTSVPALKNYVQRVQKRLGREKAREILLEFSPFIYIFPNLILLILGCPRLLRRRDLWPSARHVVPRGIPARC